MARALSRLGYSVRVDGGFVDSGQWLIHGIVEYGSEGHGPSQDDVAAEARRELVTVISEEARVARARGAKQIYVVVDGDEEVAGLFRMLDAVDRRRTRRRRRA